MSDRHLKWYIASPFYRHTYNDIAHQVDEDLFAYLGDTVQGALVIDCGCGPGIVTEKFLVEGASRVLAVDVNPMMVNQLTTRLNGHVTGGRVAPIRADFDGPLFSRLRSTENQGFDIVLFKRSLYAGRPAALHILRAAVSHLNPGGVLVIIHPEKSLAIYAFGPGLSLTSYTRYHLWNRFISRLGERLGMDSYTLYSPDEMLDLLCEAAPGCEPELVPSRQRAYVMAAVRRNGKSGSPG